MTEHLYREHLDSEGYAWAACSCGWRCIESAPEGQAPDPEDYEHHMTFVRRDEWPGLDEAEIRALGSAWGL